MGVAGDPMRLLFDKDSVPHHQYLGFYRWLSHGFNADALVHRHDSAREEAATRCRRRWEICMEIPLTQGRGITAQSRVPGEALKRPANYS